MRKLSFIFAGLFILSLLFAGCGHLDGNNPVGVTGGGANGYGGSGGTSGSGGGGNQQYDQRLFGTWRADFNSNDFEILIIGAGMYEWFDYSNGSLVESGTGAWYGANGIIYATENGVQDEYPYTVTSNELTINWGPGGGGIVTYQRYNP